MFRFGLRSVLLASAILASSGSVSSVADEIVELEEMVIQERRRTRDDVVDVDTYPAFVTVIDLDEEGGASLSITDVLKNQAGVDIREYGGLGSFSSISIRGAAPEQVVVMLDGVVLNQASGGAVDLSTIPFSQISHIEIYRGISPFQYGASAPGGVVNIRTHRAKEGVSGHVQAGYGSFDTCQLSASVSGRGDRASWVIIGDTKGSEGDYEFLDDNGTEFNPNDDEETKRINNDFVEWSGLGKIEYMFASGWTGRVSANVFSRVQGVPGVSSNQSRAAELDASRTLGTASLRNDGLHDGRVATEVRVSYHSVTYAFEDRAGPTGEVGLGRQDTENVNDTISAGATLGWEWGEQNRFGVSVDWRRDEYDPEDKLTLAAQPAGSDRETLSVSFFDEVICAGGRLTVVPVLRKEFYHSELKSDVDGVDLDSDDESPLSAQVSARYALSDWIALKAGGGAYYRAPNFFELFGDRGSTIGNPDLRPEEGRNRDIGLRAVFREDESERMWVETAYFDNEIDDLIQYVFDARGVGRPVNVGSARIRGIEVSGGARILDRVSISHRTTLQQAENTSGLPGQDGKDLPLRPRMKNSFRVEYGTTWRVWYEWNQESDRFQDTANLIELSDQDYHSSGVRLTWNSLSLSAEVSNIQDRSLSDIGGYPLPGRTVLAKLEYRW